MFPFYKKDERTDRERYLEDELETERAERQRESERQEKDRQQRRKEHQEEMESRFREADTWPEAFQKQASLCWREHNQYPDPADDYFKLSAEANEEALKLWDKVVDSKQTKLDALQAQIDAVWVDVRLEVADQLERASSYVEYKQTASAIRLDDLGDYLNW